MSEGYKVFKMGNLGQKCGYTRQLIKTATFDLHSTRYDEENEIESFLMKIGAEFLELKAIVDVRERGGMFNLMEDLGFEVRTLGVGDVVSKNVAFERKSGDFYSSVFNRKLFSQLYEIRSNYPNAYLVIDRPFEDLMMEAAKRKISENAVIGALASCAVRGFPPLFLDNKHWSALLMNAIVLKSKDGRDRKDEYDPMREAPSSDDIAMHVLMRFPKLGHNAASIIMKNCDTLEGAFELIKSVKGMTKAELKSTELSKCRAVCIQTANLITGRSDEE